MRSRSVTGVLLTILFCSLSCFAFPNRVAAVEGDSWETLAPMQEARADLGVVAVNGKIYAIGGLKSSGLFPPVGNSEVVGANEVYDPETDTWTEKAPMPTPRAHFAIAVYQNKIYCIGGTVGKEKVYYGDTSFFGYVFVKSAVNEVYDPATDTWETKAPAPRKGMFMEAAVLNDRIYMVDGPFTEVYNPENDSWTTKASAPIPKSDYDADGSNDYALLPFNNKLQVVGDFSNRILEYNPLNDSWNQGATVPVSDYFNVEGAATTGRMAPERLHFLFAPRGKTVLSQAYNPDSNDWIACKSPPTGRSYLGVAVVDDKLYAIGGYTSDGLGHFTSKALNERYTPVGYGTGPHNIDVVSPGNRTYSTENVSLSFALNKTVDWFGYSLDGRENVTIQGNTTLSGLSEGSHRLTVYAVDSMNNTEASLPVYFTVDTTLPTITMLFPENETYSHSELDFFFTVSEPVEWMGYSLDGGENVTINSNTTLSGLSEGFHSLMVYVEDYAGNSGASDPVYFTVDTTSPVIVLQSPENQTYPTGEVDLNFTVSESVSWMGYTLNGGGNVTVTGNTTLTGLSTGSHSLTLYANDTAGNMAASEPVYFTVTPQEEESFPLKWMLVVLVVAVMMVVVWWGYRRTVEE